MLCVCVSYFRTIEEVVNKMFIFNGFIVPCPMSTSTGPLCKLVQTGKPQRYKNPTQKSPWFFRFAISPCRCVKMADVFALPMNNSKVIVRLFIGKAVHKKIKHLPHEPHEAGVRGAPAAETAVNDLRHPRSRICWCRLS